MGDVEEVFQTGVSEPAGAGAGQGPGAMGPPPVAWRTRRLRQLFVRGDSVIVVSRLSQ